jgi:orotate phosphoribosyltransferase
LKYILKEKKLITKKELAKKIFNVSHLTGHFILRSGMTSNEYFDKYLFESNPGILKEITHFLKDLVPKDTEILAGLELGGIPITTALSLELGLPAIFVRKQAKTYGTCKLAEGLPFKGKKVLIVEDVITTGGQVIISSNQLREQGAIINNVVCVIEREPEGRVKLNAEKMNLLSLFTKEELKAN